MYRLIVITVLGFCCQDVLGHGMVMDPPNRSSMWRFDPSSPPNYEDNQNFCGGFTVQWSLNKGKCGICGDDYRSPQPRDNENTGKYGQGKIAKTYSQGSVIEVDVLITANHMGYFNFSLCKIEDHTKPETEECFQKLTLADGNDKYKIPSKDNGHYMVNLQLPQGLTCEQCVLRWHYHTGNTWGECENGSHQIGCGPQETFKSCSDISIV